jgi:anthranilate synthase component 2
MRAERQMHGRASTITTDQRGVFKGLPLDFRSDPLSSLVIRQLLARPCWRSSARSGM